jgi:hypothetical protein
VSAPTYPEGVIAWRVAVVVTSGSSSLGGDT